MNRALSYVLAIVLGLSAGPATGTDSKGLLLKQWSRLVGATDLLVCKQGIKLSMPSRQLVILMIPPTWDVQFQNMRSKVYWQCPADKWMPPMTRASSFLRPGDPSSLISVSSVSGTCDGLACRKHILKQPAGTNSQGMHSWERLLIKEGVLYCIDDKCYPTSVTTAITRTFGTVHVAGVPLALTCVSNRGRTEEELKLTSHMQVPVKSSDWQIPKDFKRVATSADVMGAPGSNEEFADFIH